MAAKSTDWRPGPTVCRCCLSEGCYKDISTEYFWMGKREVYAEMLLDSFNLSISYSQSGPNSNSRLICEPCISRLRDASDFKRQVQECEKTFMQYLDPGMSSLAEVEVPAEQLESQVKLEQVKVEKLGSDDDDFDDRAAFDDDDDDDLDDQPLTKLASKVPKRESVDLLDLLDNAKAAVKRKSTEKSKAGPAKKSKTTKKEVKPTSSKTVKIEKKKKEPHSRYVMARRNAEAVLQYSTAYPFRLQGKMLKCVYCCESYEDPTLYRQHMDDNHEIFTVTTAFAHLTNNEYYLKVDLIDFKCRLCLEPFDDLNSSARHIYELHECKKLNLDYEVAMQPYRLDKWNWACYICETKLPSIVALGRHTVAHYQKFTCDACGRSYYTNEALKYHIRCSHSGKHVCRKCWQEFPDAASRSDHLKTSKPCWSFCCMQCGDRFMSWEAKQKHLVEVHNCAKRVFECSYCDSVFDSRKHFRKHYKINHSDDNFICSCCGLKFADKNDLEDHRLGHTGEKLFKCTVCLKAFSRQKSLKQHLWIHSDNKRFVCTICEKQFAQKVSLKCHMKSLHPDVELEF